MAVVEAELAVVERGGRGGVVAGELLGGGDVAGDVGAVLGCVAGDPGGGAETVVGDGGEGGVEVGECVGAGGVELALGVFELEDVVHEGGVGQGGDVECSGGCGGVSDLRGEHEYEARWRHRQRSA